MPSHLVAFISFVGSSSRRVREDVGLGMLVGPELLLARLQHLGGLHHVLLILVLVEPSPKYAGIEAVFVSTIGKHNKNLTYLCFIHLQY